jgi:glucose/arabinose dehydrogenase
MIEWAARPGVRQVLTALALVVGSVIGAGVLIAGGILVREGAVYDTADGTDLVAYPVQDGLREPTAIVFAPSGEMIVAKADGTIDVFASGDADAQRLAASTLPDFRPSGGSGTLGLALDRDFAANRHLYACAGRDPGEGQPPTNQLLRLTAAPDWEIAVDAVLVNLAPVRPDRNGCAVAVDSAGHVMVGVGDARDARKVFSRRSLLGKVLQIPVETARSVVDPLLERQARRHDVATGFRDPRAIVPAPGGDPLYVADGGPAGIDEVNELVLDGDYGWPCVAANEPSSAPPSSGSTWDRRCAESEATRRPPDWSAPADRRIGIEGMAFLTAERWGPWQGALMVAASAAGELLLLEPADGGFVEAEALFDRWSWRPGPMAVGPNGDLYVAVTTGTTTAKIMRVGPSD